MMGDVVMRDEMLERDGYLSINGGKKCVKCVK